MISVDIRIDRSYCHLVDMEIDAVKLKQDCFRLLFDQLSAKEESLRREHQFSDWMRN